MEHNLCGSTWRHMLHPQDTLLTDVKTYRHLRFDHILHLDMQVLYFQLHTLSSLHWCCTSKLWLLKLWENRRKKRCWEGGEGQTLVELSSRIWDFFICVDLCIIHISKHAFCCCIIKYITHPCYVGRRQMPKCSKGCTWFLSWVISLLLGALLFRWSSIICASARRTLVLFRSFLSLFSVSTSLWLTWMTNHSFIAQHRYFPPWKPIATLETQKHFLSNQNKWQTLNCTDLTTRTCSE